MLCDNVGNAIIGATTSTVQLEDDLTALNDGSLPAEMMKAFDVSWSISRGMAVKPYLRPIPEQCRAHCHLLIRGDRCPVIPS